MSLSSRAERSDPRGAGVGPVSPATVDGDWSRLVDRGCYDTCSTSSAWATARSRATPQPPTAPVRRERFAQCLRRVAPRAYRGAMTMFSPTGWIAHFTGNEFAVLAVESFNDDGVPMVVDQGLNKLRTARGITGFQGIERSGRIAAAVAVAPGWRLRIWEGHDRRQLGRADRAVADQRRQLDDAGPRRQRLVVGAAGQPGDRDPAPEKYREPAAEELPVGLLSRRRRPVWGSEPDPPSPRSSMEASPWHPFTQG
jgi:hypothetical protein